MHICAGYMNLRKRFDGIRTMTRNNKNDWIDTFSNNGFIKREANNIPICYNPTHAKTRLQTWLHQAHIKKRFNSSSCANGWREVRNSSVYVNTGSRYEPAEWSGISHFLEHMVFKATENYPTPELLSQAVDAVGAEFNAFTSKEYTGYYVKSASAHINLA